MEGTAMKQTVDASLLKRYFNEEVTPSSFLDGLHSAIVEHVRLAGGRYLPGIEEVSGTVDFLGCFYEAVKAAIVEEEGD